MQGTAALRQQHDNIRMCVNLMHFLNVSASLVAPSAVTLVPVVMPGAVSIHSYR